MSTRAQREQQKKAFLEAFARTGVVLTAARQAGVGRTTVYQWLERDEAFLLAYRQAEKDACDVLVATALQRAVQGVRRERGVYHQGQQIAVEAEIEYSDSLLMFLIKKRDPSYRESSKLQVEHSGPDGGPIRTRTETADAFDYDAYRALFLAAAVHPEPAALGADDPGQPLAAADADAEASVLPGAAGR